MFNNKQPQASVKHFGRGKVYKNLKQMITGANKETTNDELQSV